MIEQLTSVGLTNTEAKLYVILLELGRSQAGALSRKTGIHRRSVYDALERLIEKGLVSYIRENQKRIYVPSSPNRIGELMSEMKGQIDTVLPLLTAKYDAVKQKEETSFFRGKEGIKTIFEDELRDKNEILVISTPRRPTENLRHYIAQYTQKRIKAKIRMKLLYSQSEQRSKVQLAQVRYLPDHFASPVSTSIYGDKVAIVVWGVEPVGLLIQNKEIADVYRKYFEVLWAVAKP